MEPMKSLVPFAKWLLRITLAVVVYGLYFERLLDFDVSSVPWLISLLMVLFTVLLLVGGFTKRSSLTVISGLVVALLSVVMIFFDGIDLASFSSHIAPAAIGFYFLARGNKG